MRIICWETLPNWHLKASKLFQNFFSAPRGGGAKNGAKNLQIIFFQKKLDFQDGIYGPNTKQMSLLQSFKSKYWWEVPEVGGMTLHIIYIINSVTLHINSVTLHNIGVATQRQVSRQAAVGKSLSCDR